MIISAKAYYFKLRSVALPYSKVHHLLTGIAFEGDTICTKTKPPVGGSVYITQQVIIYQIASQEDIIIHLVFLIMRMYFGKRFV